MIDPSLSRPLPSLWFVAMVGCFVGFACDLCRLRAPLSCLQTLSLCAIGLFEVVVGSGLALDVAFAGDGRIIASGGSADGRFRARLVHGVNWEGDDATLIYRRSGEFFCHPLERVGADLTHIEGATITFPSSSTLRFSTSISFNGKPAQTFVEDFDLSTAPPRSTATTWVAH